MNTACAIIALIIAMPLNPQPLVKGSGVKKLKTFKLYECSTEAIFVSFFVF